jgi:hypothetical protein
MQRLRSGVIELPMVKKVDLLGKFRELSIAI